MFRFDHSLPRRFLVLVTAFSAASLACTQNELTSPPEVATAIDQAANASAGHGGSTFGLETAAARRGLRVCHRVTGPRTYLTVAEAVAAAEGGEFIRICDGTHIVQDVRINKALTIVAEGPGKPMLDADGARSNFDIRDVVGGDVVLRGLQFRGTWMSTNEAPRPGFGANVNIERSYSRITIEGSDFFPSGQFVAYQMPQPGQPGLSHNSGIWVWDATGNGITIRNNTFTGGDVGVGGAGTDLLIQSNTFRAQSNAAVNRGLAAGTTIIDDNEIADCGTAWCIVADDNGSIITRNRIRVEAPRQTHQAILLNTPEATVSENVIEGVGGARIGADKSSYPITYGIAAYSARRSTVTVYRITKNAVSGTYSGIDFASIVQIGGGPVDAVATDNIVHDVATPFSGSGGSGMITARLNRNDFSSYAVGTDPEFQGSSFQTVELTCNWWGQPSGPSGYFPATWVGTVHPVATEPIAGRSHVKCP